MSEAQKYAHPLRVADLSPRKPTHVTLEPSAEVLAEIASELDLTGLRKLRFRAELRALGKSDWELTGDLGATATQNCVVTLEPVTTRIDTKVRRVYTASPENTSDDEETLDEESEPLGDVIDPGQVMVEALSIALPDYPRADGVTFEKTQVSAPGVAPLTDESSRPFAGLAELRDKLEKGD